MCKGLCLSKEIHFQIETHIQGVLGLDHDRICASQRIFCAALVQLQLRGSIWIEVIYVYRLFRRLFVRNRYHIDVLSIICRQERPRSESAVQDSVPLYGFKVLRHRCAFGAGVRGFCEYLHSFGVSKFVQNSENQKVGFVYTAAQFRYCQEVAA